MPAASACTGGAAQSEHHSIQPLVLTVSETAVQVQLVDCSLPGTLVVESKATVSPAGPSWQADTIAKPEATALCCQAEQREQAKEEVLDAGLPALSPSPAEKEIQPEGPHAASNGHRNAYVTCASMRQQS